MTIGNQDTPGWNGKDCVLRMERTGKTGSYTHCAPVRGHATSHLEPPILNMEVLRHLWLETDPTAMGSRSGQTGVLRTSTGGK